MYLCIYAIGERGAHFMAYKLYGEEINSINNSNENEKIINTNNTNNKDNIENDNSYTNLINSCRNVAFIALVTFGLIKARNLIK
jgi:hypothetical protein